MDGLKLDATIVTKRRVVMIKKVYGRSSCDGCYYKVKDYGCRHLDYPVCMRDGFIFVEEPDFKPGDTVLVNGWEAIYVGEVGGLYYCIHDGDNCATPHKHIEKYRSVVFKDDCVIIDGVEYNANNLLNLVGQK